MQRGAQTFPGNVLFSYPRRESLVPGDNANALSTVPQHPKNNHFVGCQGVLETINH